MNTNEKFTFNAPDASAQSVPEDVRLHASIVSELHDTFKRKNHDYGNSFSELYAEVGMPYAYGHLKEKLNRVKSLMNDKAQVEGESIDDSLLDLANYAILTVMEHRRKQNH